MPQAASDIVTLDDGWEVAACPPDGCPTPAEAQGLEWIPAVVPGTAAAALRAAGRWSVGDARDFDRDDWWFRTRFAAPDPAPGERLSLAFGGIATVSEVYLNGERILESGSMFAAHEIDITERVGPENELAIRCLALTPLLALARRPRARWRTRLVFERNLRFFRTMLLGRAPGFAPGPAAVGPFKPVSLIRRRGLTVSDVVLRGAVREGVPQVTVRGRVEWLGPAEAHVDLALSGPGGPFRGPLTVSDGELSGELRAAGAELWWPHTHGSSPLYEARLVVGDAYTADLGRVGFRTLEAAGDLIQDGIQLRINGASVFARGAVWTPLDLARPASELATLRPVLESVVAAGLNMLRVPGIGCYESEAFHDLCDELGILVWQDFMFANMDYPDRDAHFMETVRAEAHQLLRDLGRHPSLAVLCGGSEVAQQATMMGLDPTVTGGALYEELLPEEIARADVAVPYVPSSPWGGVLPFRPGRGVANYYGVGAYLRPLTDARVAEVRFAGECLAFANVPDEEGLAATVVHDPRWKAGVPRDAGAGWDFDDVRDHYLRALHDVDPLALRYADPERYLDVSRHVSAELMAEVFGEWRREDSPCGGGLVLWLTDLVPGAGWGILDHRALPKVAYHYLRRACAPVAVWSIDEGLGGVMVHVANDRPQALRADLRVATYTDFERVVDETTMPIEVAPHSAFAADLEGLLGRFVDASWAYRFGPPAQNLIVLSLESQAGQLSQAFRLPAGRPMMDSADRLGLIASLRVAGDRGELVVSSRRLAYGVRVHVPGFVPEDDAFSVEPGHARTVALRRSHHAEGEAAGGHLTALNLAGRAPVTPAD